MSDEGGGMKSAGNDTTELLRVAQSDNGVNFVWSVVDAESEAFLLSAHKSSGFNPVRFAIRASIFGPTSSRSWNAKTKSGHPSRASTR